MSYLGCLSGIYKRTPVGQRNGRWCRLDMSREWNEWRVFQQQTTCRRESAHRDRFRAANLFLILPVWAHGPYPSVSTHTRTEQYIVLVSEFANWLESMAMITFPKIVSKPSEKSTHTIKSTKRDVISLMTLIQIEVIKEYLTSNSSRSNTWLRNQSHTSGTTEWLSNRCHTRTRTHRRTHSLCCTLLTVYAGVVKSWVLRL